ncbi:hypothetical protein DUNSADRAFT_11488 [Dunaliella salina]|uniref:Encoded protein n=1 Tax=Dunaliella salina TaxID=3046 RepID=A0ABQ7GDE8_DUNSA|nr:hypothetical protein DUNSADRAFT_11488 [Dunaliella salina]|eukprot:KAF5832558.1 hypothetical protein DUNSADRAFT_11488 [Dunaliella salina]
MQQGAEEAGADERPESTPSGRRSLSYSRGRRSLSVTRLRLSVDRANEGRDQSPGKSSCSGCCQVPTLGCCSVPTLVL